MIKELGLLRDGISDLISFIAEKGTEVQYEVEFVGGTFPLDTPHISAGHLARYLQRDAEKIFNSAEFEELIIGVEQAEEQYDEEYENAFRELDLRR